MRLKCCVGGCNATNETHRLFAFPKKDMLRDLWMSFLVPTNPLLLGLTKEALLRKRVCEKHFDKNQFDEEGKRLRYSYPCLFTDDEITHGEPLAAVGTVPHALSDHNYFKDQDDEEDATEQTLVIGRPGEDFHEHPSSSYSQDEASVPQNKVKPLQLDDAILEFKMTNYMEKTTPYPSDDEDIETDYDSMGQSNLSAMTHRMPLELPLSLLSIEAIFLRISAAKPSVRASANISEALHHLGSPKSILNALLY